MRIGVIADTHIPDILPALPVGVRTALQGLDIILHVGDICTLETLREIQNTFTITMAVRGEHEDEQAQHYLEETRVVEFLNRRIGMIHGHQAKEPASFISSITSIFNLKKKEKSPNQTICEYALKLFTNVDCIIFGHTHQPYLRMHGTVLMLNPGAVAPQSGARQSMGILEIGERNIVGKIIYI